MTTVFLKTQSSDNRTAPLKLTIPESWAGAPLSKLIKAWSKRKQCSGEPYLASADGTPIPNEWPWEAAVELYGSTLRVGERRETPASNAAGWSKFSRERSSDVKPSQGLCVGYRPIRTRTRTS